MRESTSQNQANGSTRQRLQVATTLNRTAAVLPPLSLPKNVQLPRPIAISRLARSVAPLSISKIAVFKKARERGPLIQRIAYSACGQNIVADFEQILMQFFLLRNASRSSPASPLARSSIEYRRAIRCNALPMRGWSASRSAKGRTTR